MAWVTNGNMTRKLLDKTLRAYLLYAACVLLVSAPSFYFMTQNLYLEETDEALALHKQEFIQQTAPALKKNEIVIWNKFNRDVKILPYKTMAGDSFFYTTYLDTLANEYEPYRQLNANIIIEGKPYNYAGRINLVESEDLIESIAGLFLVLIFLMLAGFFFITRRLSSQLWKPFYNTLTQIENFEIDKGNKPAFMPSDIEEFKRLNMSITKLADRNIQIYRSQREFVENAAHELQTPLAVFQAKIDTLVQVSELTADQYEIVDALQESVNRLNRLNRNLLLLSRIENKQFPEMENLNPGNQVLKNMEFFKEQAASKNLHIETELDEEQTIKANPVLVEILLNNLFLNAIRHNVENGKIRIELLAGKLTFSNTGNPKALLEENLFNRFSKSTTSQSGNGLGLAIVKKIADLNHWQMLYEFKDNLHTFSIHF